jgi:hypothetical protein
VKGCPAFSTTENLPLGAAALGARRFLVIGRRNPQTLTIPAGSILPAARFPCINGDVPAGGSAAETFDASTL